MNSFPEAEQVLRKHRLKLVKPEAANDISEAISDEENARRWEESREPRRRVNWEPLLVVCLSAGVWALLMWAIVAWSKLR